MLQTVAFCSFFYIIPAGALWLIPWALSRHRARWGVEEVLLYAAPFLVRSALHLLREKGAWNLPYESFILGVGTSLLTATIVVAGRNPARRKWRYWGSGLLSLFGVLLWLLVGRADEN